MSSLPYAIIADRRSAIRYVLDPARIAEVLARIRRKRFLLPAPRPEAPAPTEDRLLEALRDAPVRDVFCARTSVTVVGEATPLDDFLPKALESLQATIPVVNARGSFVGMLPLDLVCAFYDEAIGRLAIAADCAAPFSSVTPIDSLATAFQRLDACQCAELPVIEPGFSRTIIGFLSYETALQVYLRRLSEIDDALDS